MPTHLIDTTKLHVDVEVLLVEALEQGVKKTAEEWAGDLLDDFRAGPLCVILRDTGAQPVHVHVVGFCELVRGTDDKDQTFGGDTHGPEHGEENVLVVIDALLHELQRSFEVVEEGVHIGEEHLYFDTCTEKISDLGQSNEVANVRLARGRRAPVEPQRPLILLEQPLDGLGSKDLLKVARDELVALGR